MRGFGFFILIVVFWLLPTIIKAKKNQQAKGSSAGAANTNAAQRPAPSVQLHRPVPSMNRSAHRDFSAPEAPCIVCEQTGEDHFQRDKVRRLQQLDEWLKIGLIARSEYLVLRDRYQRGI